MLPLAETFADEFFVGFVCFIQDGSEVGMKEVPQGESIYSVLSILDILTVKCQNNCQHIQVAVQIKQTTKTLNLSGGPRFFCEGWLSGRF